jgi:hypothetical protein
VNRLRTVGMLVFCKYHENAYKKNLPAREARLEKRCLFHSHLLPIISSSFPQSFSSMLILPSSTHPHISTLRDLSLVCPLTLLSFLAFLFALILLSFCPFVLESSSRSQSSSPSCTCLNPLFCTKSRWRTPRKGESLSHTYFDSIY